MSYPVIGCFPRLIFTPRLNTETRDINCFITFYPHSTTYNNAIVLPTTITWHGAKIVHAVVDMVDYQQI